MTIQGLVKKGEYFDSVTLMMVARRIASIPGVDDSAVVMGTNQNKAILKSAGLLLPELENAGDSDLLIAVKASGGKEAEAALREADQYLRDTRKGTPASRECGPKSLQSALRLLPDANMALISVAGRFAGTVAMECLRRGLHVMLFSDNVSVEEEIALKKYADSRGLLVMGPDCGSAIINGVPLGFANAVRRGHVGIVAAAGTGLQEVSTIVSNRGAGISQAIGTGGRDVKKEIGGAAFLRGLEALAEDTHTGVIVLISKPPHPDVLLKIRSEACRIPKPIVSVFLGGEEASMKACGLHPCSTLEEAALLAVALSKGEVPDEALAGLKMRDQHLEQIASDEARERRKGRHYVRGLFCGGTLAAEAQVILKPIIGDIYSNVPLSSGFRLRNSLESVANTVVDFGEDEFTVGRPHPMIDYSLRNRRIVEEARDPETSVILLDVVIGYGSNPRPAEDLIPALTTARAIALSANRRLWIVCSVTGTDQDPQCRAEVARALEESGSMVAESNAAACRLAGLVVKKLQTGSQD